MTTGVEQTFDPEFSDAHNFRPRPDRQIEAKKEVVVV